MAALYYHNYAASPIIFEIFDRYTHQFTLSFSLHFYRAIACQPVREERAADPPKEERVVDHPRVAREDQLACPTAAREASPAVDLPRVAREVASACPKAVKEAREADHHPREAREDQ